MVSVGLQVMDVGGILVHQLLCGRDIANPQEACDENHQKLYAFAENMRNFVYLVVDPIAKQGFVLDGCWDVDGIVAYAEKLNVEIVGALYSHSHFDHAGGLVPAAMTGGLPVLLQGVQDFVRRGVPVWAGNDDAQAIIQQCQVGAGDVKIVEEGDKLGVGRAQCTAFATPGHTPGSVCLFVPCGGGGGDELGVSGTRVPASSGALLSGDTLFVQSCGRYDLPGSDEGEMFRSLSRLVQFLPDDCVVCPGHDYANVPHTTIRQERDTNQMVSFGLQRWKTPGELPSYGRCNCASRFGQAAREVFARPGLQIRDLGGGEVTVDGVPFERATCAELKKLLFDHIVAAKSSGRKVKSPASITLALGSGSRQLADDDLLKDPCLAEEGIVAFGCELPLEPPQLAWFPVGADVRLDGLRGATELNGRRGKIRGFEVEKGRYTVVLISLRAETKSLKADNIFLAPLRNPPPPPAPPAPDVD